MHQGNSEISIARPDVALLLDNQGIIQNVTLSKSLAAGNGKEWIGRPWVDTVGDVGDDKVRRMVAEANSSGVSAFRQFTQCFPNGLELPMEYTTVQLGGDKGLLAIGKNLQAVAEMQSRLVTAQQAMEREYWKLRYLETRYRLLLESSSEPVLLVKESSMRLVEANPSASRALGIPSGNGAALEKIELFSLVPSGERQQLKSILRRVRDEGKTPAMLLHLGRERNPWYVKASMVTSEQGLVYFLQLTPPTAQKAEPDKTIQFEQLFDRTPDALVMIDNRGMILRFNQAFRDMIQVGSEVSLEDQPLGHWLGRPGADVKVLLTNVALHGSIRLFSTTLQGESGVTTEVEISAVGDNAEEVDRVGLVIRDVGSRLPAVEKSGTELGAWLQMSTRQIGTSPLRKLVKETVGIVESHYIEAALKLTDGNRTAAAELLGISRQSLYAKLGRYDLGTRNNPTT